MSDRMIPKCLTHSRRTHVVRFVYFDQHGIAYEQYHCLECRDRKLDSEIGWYNPMGELAFHKRERLCDGNCGITTNQAGRDFHRDLEGTFTVREPQVALKP